MLIQNFFYNRSSVSYRQSADGVNISCLSPQVWTIPVRIFCKVNTSSQSNHLIVTLRASRMGILVQVQIRPVKVIYRFRIAQSTKFHQMWVASSSATKSKESVNNPPSAEGQCEQSK